MLAKWYGNALSGQWGTTAVRRVDWATDAAKVSLHAVGYVPNQDSDTFFSSATSELATAGGYTAGGFVLTGKTVTYVGASNEVQLDAIDASWTSATFTAYRAVTYVDTAGAATTDPLLGYVDFEGAESVTTGTFTIQWDPTGVLKVTAA